MIFITVEIFKHTAEKNNKIKRADTFLTEVYGTILSERTNDVRFVFTPISGVHAFLCDTCNYLRILVSITRWMPLVEQDLLPFQPTRVHNSGITGISVQVYVFRFLFSYYDIQYYNLVIKCKSDVWFVISTYFAFGICVSLCKVVSNI